MVDMTVDTMVDMTVDMTVDMVVAYFSSNEYWLKGRQRRVVLNASYSEWADVISGVLVKNVKRKHLEIV